MIFVSNRTVIGSGEVGYMKVKVKIHDLLTGLAATFTSFDQGSELFKVVDDKIGTRTCEFLLCKRSRDWRGNAFTVIMLLRSGHQFYLGSQSWKSSAGGVMPSRFIL